MLGYELACVGVCICVTATSPYAAHALQWSANVHMHISRFASDLSALC